MNTLTFQIEPDDPRRLAMLCGLANDNLKLLEDRLNIRISQRGNNFTLSGEADGVTLARDLLNALYLETQDADDLPPDVVHLHLRHANIDQQTELSEIWSEEKLHQIQTPKSVVKPRGPHQKEYIHNMLTHDINFGIGPAGTGKTFLAVACAVHALMKDEVRRILLVRPAVEAGEKLGFLPGDLSQKVDPYLRPLYDALYEMLGFEKVDRLIEKNVIEVAPLAYMRGRTLSNSFIILDESQNCTKEQMKMFLTRIGFGSTAVITGDPSQVDLPRHQGSGLAHALHVLNGVEGISFNWFDSKDVVRHPLVQRIVDAYDKTETENGASDTN